MPLVLTTQTETESFSIVFGDFVPDGDVLHLPLSSITNRSTSRIRNFYTSGGLVTQGLGRSEDGMTLSGEFPTVSNFKYTQTTETTLVDVPGGGSVLEETKVSNVHRDSYEAVVDHLENFKASERVVSLFDAFLVRGSVGIGTVGDFYITELRVEDPEFRVGRSILKRWSMTLSEANDVST